jgi:hypothetical protein
MKFNRSEHQALQAFLLACSPRITATHFEKIIEDACEYGLTIEGNTYREPEKLVRELSRMNAYDPITFCAYFQEIYLKLSSILKAQEGVSHYVSNRLVTPKDPLQVAKAALSFRLSKRDPSLSWDDFLSLVAESLDLGVNRQPTGLGKRFSKRMNSLLSIYMLSGSQFDDTLDWLIQETQYRRARPAEFPRGPERRKKEKAFAAYLNRLRTLATSDRWDSKEAPSLSSVERAFEQAVVQTYGARIGPLMRSWACGIPDKARYGLLMYKLYLEGNIRAVDPLIEALSRTAPRVRASRHKYSKAGDPWDTADHWGWYY